MKRFIALVFLALTPLSTAAAAGKEAPPSLVVTAPVHRGIVSPLQTFVGTLYYNKQSKLASEVEGVVGSLSVREGQALAKGDTVLSLDTQVLQARVAAKSSDYEALKADLTRQERDLERARELSERKSMSRSNYDRAFYATEQLRAQAGSVKSELAGLQILLEKSRIRAPFAGVITTLDVEVGEWVGKGTTIATVVDPDSIEARLSLPARLLDGLEGAGSFAATVAGKDIQVSLITVIPVADAATRTFPVKMALPETRGLIEGMRIDVLVPTLKEQESLMVPRDAVIKRFGQTVVFTVREGKAIMVPVQVIGYKTDLAAISGAGINEQVRVVTKGNERIFPNMPVVEQNGNQ